jgi:hypothetical protein
LWPQSLQRGLTANAPARRPQGNAKATGPARSSEGEKAAGILPVGEARKLVDERGHRDHGPGYALAEFPNAERWVRTLRNECSDRMLIDNGLLYPIFVQACGWLVLLGRSSAFLQGPADRQEPVHS